MAMLKEKSRMVWEYVRDHDNGNGIPMSEIAEGTGLTIKQLGPIVWTSLKEKKDGSRGALVKYEKREIPGMEKPVGYVHITEEGKNYVEIEEEIAD